jgi:hypothetical protein
MNMKTKLLVVAAGAAVVGTLYFHRAEISDESSRDSTKKFSAPAPAESNTSPKAPAPQPIPHPEPGVALAYAMLNKGSSMRSTLDQVVGSGGNVRSAGLATLIQSTDAACSDMRLNAPHYLGKSQLKDSSRNWATKRLLEICHEFDSRSYQFDFPRDGLISLLREKGEQTAIDASLRALRKESDPSELYSAGQILWEHDRSKLNAILPDGGKAYGDEEIMKAWALATTLLACDDAGGCGPNSLQTVAFCANTGCKSGSSFSQALRQRLPDAEYRAVNSFYNWIVVHRKS